MIKYPSTEQFRNAVDRVTRVTRYAGKDEAGAPIFDHQITLPTLEAFGTVKIHGTNAGVVFVFDENGDQVCDPIFQSRNRILSIGSDNSGFMAAMSRPHIVDLLKRFVPRVHAKGKQTKTAIYGEWAGPGIQSGVGVNKLSRPIFFIFSVKVVCGEDSYWFDFSRTNDVAPDELRRYNDAGIYFIGQFQTFSVDVDFNNPSAAYEEMMRLTQEVENQCPVAKSFGFEGTGEGIVWRIRRFSERLLFKTKGEKHSVVSEKKIKEIDTESDQKAQKFAEAVLTEARLEQGFGHIQTELLLEAAPSSVGPFIKWMFEDILKEEGDRIVELGINAKYLNKIIATGSRRWFLQRINA